jgi:osmotically-inducible protein OsmY
MSKLLQITFPQNQDNRIHDDVRRQLTWQSDIQSEEIEVAVQDSKVFLTGCVETCFEKAEAERAANAVYGVTCVLNNIKVDPKQFRTDPEIEADITAALQACTSVVEELPDVTVRNGVAIMQGRSRWEFQRHGAEQLALAIVGVKRVVNLIVIDPTAIGARRHQKPLSFYQQHSQLSMRAS